MDGINIKYYIFFAIIFFSIMIGLFIFNPGKIDPNDSMVHYELYHNEIIYVKDNVFLHEIDYSIEGDIERQCYSPDTIVIILCKRCILNRIRSEVKEEISDNFKYEIYLSNPENFELYMMNRIQHILPYFDINHLHIKHVKNFKLIRDTIPDN